jgi:hypothetical protein
MPQLRMKNLQLILVVSLAIALVCDPRLGHAQDKENPANDATTSGTASGVGANEPATVRPSMQGGHFRQIPARVDALTHLPPMLAVRGISDSEQMKKVLRSMITSQVPVMYQTMMMVENGAATGFVGSMKTVSKLLNNVTNSAQLEIRMKQISDPTGAEALGYANSIHKGMKEQEAVQGKNLWPVGIFYASGDRLDTAPLKSGETIKEKPDPKAGGSSKLDAVQKSSSGSAPNPGSPAASNEIKLSEILWGGYTDTAAGPNAPQSTNFADDKNFQTLLVGDIVMQKGNTSQGQPTSEAKVIFKDAEFKVKDKNPPEGRTGDQYLRGFHYWKHKTKREMWRKTYMLMEEYCSFKADNENRGKKLFAKLTPASKITPEMIKNTSSPSFKWTVNLLDIFFKIWVETRSMDPRIPTKIECDFENPDADASMPEDYKAPDAKFDNCTENPKYCTRNKWILRLVDLIAEDRVIADFKNWHESAINHALGQHPWVAMKVEELLCTSLRAGRTVENVQSKDIVLCDSSAWLESLAEENRQRWVKILTDLSKMAQNAVGSSAFRPQPNSVQNSQGGGISNGSSN